MASLQIRLARQEDVPVVAAMDVAAFADSPMHKAMFPESLRVKAGTGDPIEWNTRRVQRGLDDSSTRHILAIESTDDGSEIIVACAEWCAPENAAAVEEPKTLEQRQQERETSLARLPSYLDKSAVQSAGAEIAKLLESQDCLQAFEGKSREEMWTLNSIAVAQEHRKRGIGKMLVRWGIDKAAEKSENIWLIAAPSGKNMYESLGFIVVATGSRCGEPQYVMTRFAGTD